MYRCCKLFAKIKLSLPSYLLNLEVLCPYKYTGFAWGGGGFQFHVIFHLIALQKNSYEVLRCKINKLMAYLRLPLQGLSQSIDEKLLMILQFVTI